MSKERAKSKTTQNNEIYVKNSVLPSELFQKYLEQELPESFKEIIGNPEEEKFIKKLGENVKYLKFLEGTSYAFTSKGLENSKLENPKISDVLIIPLKERNLIGAESTKSNLEIMAIISPSGEVLSPIVRTTEDIENGKWMTDPIWWKK